MIVATGMTDMIQALIDGLLTLAPGSIMQLYSNDVLLSPSTVIDDLQTPLFGGYSPSGPQTAWQIGVDPVSGHRMIFIDSVFTGVADGTGTLPDVVRGWFIQSVDGDLIVANKFPAPFNVVQAGDVVQFSPQIIFPTSFNN